MQNTTIQTVCNLTADMPDQDLVATLGAMGGASGDNPATQFPRDTDFSDYIEGQRPLERVCSTVRLFGIFTLAVLAVAWREASTQVSALRYGAADALEQLPAMLASDPCAREIARLVATARRDPRFRQEMQSIFCEARLGAGFRRQQAPRLRRRAHRATV